MEDEAKQLALTDDDQRRVTQNMAKTNLFWFAHDFLGYPDIVEQPHRRMSQFINGESINADDLMPGAVYEQGRGRRAVMNEMSDRALDRCPLDRRLIGRRMLLRAARGSLKSTLVVSFVVQQILKNKDITVCYASQKKDNAAKFVTAIRNHLTDSRLREYFGRFHEKDAWSKSEITVLGRSKHELDATVTSAGVEVGKVSTHAWILILDDIYDDTNSYTEDGRAYVLAYYRKMLSVLRRGGMVLVIGTMWHPQDFGEWIIADNEQSRKWDILSEPVCTFTDSTWTETGRLYWPEGLGPKALEDKLEELHRYDFSLQFLMRLDSSEKSRITPEMLRRVPIDKLPKRLNVVIAVDPASTEEKRGQRRRCYHGIAAVGMDKHHNAYLLYGNRIRGDKFVFAKTIQEVYKRMKRPGWTVFPIVIENVAFSYLLIGEIRATIADPHEAAQLPFKKVPVAPRDAKIRRIETALHWFEQTGSDGGPRLKLAASIPANSVIESDIRLFPDINSLERDFLDALAKALEELVPPTGFDDDDTKRKWTEDDYWEFVGEGRLPPRDCVKAMRARDAMRAPVIGYSNVVGQTVDIRRRHKFVQTLEPGHTYTASELIDGEREEETELWRHSI